MTELLYLPDEDDVTTFSASVSEATAGYVILDGTYFYPEGGGQPADHGILEWDGGRAEVVGARKDHGEVRHELGDVEGDLPEAGAAIEGRVDETRRQRLTRMHTAQHVVSRVVLDEYGAATAGNQIHVDRSRIDFEPADFDAGDLETIQRGSNAAIEADLSVRKENQPRNRVEATVDEKRALLELIPESVDPLRVVEIDSFDLCPCGGTHVDSLGDIGEIEIVDHISKGADTDRIEFELSGA